MDLVEKLDKLINLMSEQKGPKFEVGDRVEIIDKRKRGRIEEIFDYDPIIGEYQYQVNGEIYIESQLKKG